MAASISAAAATADRELVITRVFDAPRRLVFRLLGGGVAGDDASGRPHIPRSQLAVLPGTTHVTLIDRVDWLLSMVGEFLDAPMPQADPPPGR